MPDRFDEGKVEDQDFRIRVWNQADSVSGSVENVLEAFTLELFGEHRFDPGEYGDLLDRIANSAADLSAELFTLAREAS